MLKDDKYPKPDYYFYKRYFDKKRNRATFAMFRSDTRDQIKASCDLQVLRDICKKKGVPLLTYEEEQEQELHKKTNQIEKRQKILDLMPDPDFFYIQMSYNKTRPKYLLHRPGFKPLVASFTNLEYLYEWVEQKYPGIKVLTPDEYKKYRNIPKNDTEYYVREAINNGVSKYQLMKSFPKSDWSHVYIEISDDKEKLEEKAKLLNNKNYERTNTIVSQSNIKEINKQYKKMVGDLIIINDDVIIEKTGRYLKDYLYENYYHQVIKKCEKVIFADDDHFNFNKDNLIIDDSRCKNS